MAELSPAAQAVLGAATDAWLDADDDIPALVAVAALCALADQAGSAKHWHVNELRAIAAELHRESTRQED